MKAVVVSEQGGPEVMALEDRPTPDPGPDEALVEITASGVNFIDIYQRSGAYAMPTPFVAGSEAAGVVAAVGERVPDVAVGDRVAWAMVTDGTYATHAVVPAQKLVPVPDGVDDEVAAAVMLQGMTAQYLCETTYPARPGDDALVHAGAGGVGLLLTQMLVLKGARVFTTTSTPQKAELSRGAGAAEVIDYSRQDVAAEVRRLTDGRGVAVVYDGVGASTFEASLDSLRPRGLLALFGASSGPVPPFDPQTLNAKGSLFLTRPSLAHYLLDRAELL
ncbi:MAG: quinone oxidoreductase family protein, partial [Nocardioidaceae bacterium]